MNYMNQIITIGLGLSIILKILLIAIGAFIFIKIVYRLTNRIENKWHIDTTVIYVLNDLLKYFILVIAFAWILEVFGIDIKAIILSLGIIGIAIGIASKDIVSNFISGLFVLSDKSIRVGDVISVDNDKGTVKKIGLRTTTIINQDKQVITIPNSVLNAKQYKRYLPLEDYRIDVYSTLPSNVNLEEFEKDVTEAITKYDWVNKEHGLLIKGDLVTEDAPKMLVSTWTTNYEILGPGKVIIMNEINQLIHNKYTKKPSKKIKRRYARKDKINTKEEIEKLEKEIKNLEMEINYLHEKDTLIEEEIAKKE
ncbi:MAG: mechanosensitive ion channel family protein [archaeon]|nr:mechanosensitive ion channel family protein [archaeon]